MAEKLKHYEDGFTTTTEKDGGREQEAVVITEPGEVHSPEILAKDVYEIVEEADRQQDEHLLDNYYDKEQVDGKLALKADKATTYTKTETNNLLNEKQDIVDGESVDSGVVSAILGLDSMGNLVKGAVPTGTVIVDDELSTESENPVQNKVITNALDDKANVDGNYPTMSVGHADSSSSLDTTIGNDDQTPFNYQTSGGSADVETGMQKLDKLVGVDVVKNQYAKPFTDNAWGDFLFASTISVNDGVLTATTNNANKDVGFGQACSIIANHLYLAVFNISNASAGLNLHFTLKGTVYTATTGWNYIIASKTSNDTEFGVYSQNDNVDGASISCSYFKLIDLTQRYGSNEVVNAIIGSDTSKQVANLLKFDNNILADTTYDTGTLVNSKSAKLKTVGYNQFKALDTNIKAVAGTIYRLMYWNDTALANITSGSVKQYDVNGNLIKTTNYGDLSIIHDLNNSYPNSTDKGFKTELETYYIQISGVSNSNILLNVAWDGSKTDFEEYEEHIYDLPNKDQHGVLKVVSGKVVADGDELYPDGSGKTRYGVYTFTGNETWNEFGEAGARNCYITEVANAIKKPANNNTVLDVICSTLTRTFVNNLYLGNISSGIAIEDNGSIWISASDYANISSLTGKKLIYPLATETDLTEQGSFPSQIFADDFGTMQFLKSNNAQIDGLQGAEIFYKANVSGFAESLYVKTDGDVDDIVYQDELTIVNNKIGAKLPECPTTTDGTYVLKATVSDGEVVYSWVAEV